MKKEVFISYSSREADIAYRVKNTLENKGISCWMAPDCIAPGANYLQEIPDGINDCKIFLLLLSPAAQDSTWVLNELSQATSLGKFVIPFMVKKSEINKAFAFALSSSQIVDASDNLENSLPGLVYRISSILRSGKSVDEKVAEENARLMSKAIQDRAKILAKAKPQEKTPPTKMLRFGKEDKFAVALVFAFCMFVAAIASIIFTKEDHLYLFFAARKVNFVALFITLFSSSCILFGIVREVKWAITCYWASVIAVGVLFTEFARILLGISSSSLVVVISVAWFLVMVCMAALFARKRKIFRLRFVYFNNLFYCLALYPFVALTMNSIIAFRMPENKMLITTSAVFFVLEILASCMHLCKWNKKL